MLSDSPDEIRTKLKKAVTDSGKEIYFDTDSKPAISNLLTILSFFSGKKISELEKEFKNSSYSEFKAALAEEIIKGLKPIQEKRAKITEAQVKEILQKGTAKSAEVVNKTLGEVQHAMKIAYPRIFG
jgi:tryptophanyl-tRNA synthetase